MIRGYRVWDNQEKTYSDKAFSIDQLGICYVQDEDGYWEEIDDSRFIVEFETGLTDKNADMICEGDIMEFGIAGAENRGVVGYEEDFGSYETYTSKGYIIASLFTCRGKIIGNIHENPELLGGEK